MINLTNKNTVLLYDVFVGSGTAPWEISVHTRANDYQASRFLTPQLLLDKLCTNLPGGRDLHGRDFDTGLFLGVRQ